MAFNERAYQQQFDALLATCEREVERTLLTELQRDHRLDGDHNVTLLAKLVVNQVFFEVYREGFIELKVKEGRHVA